MSLTAPHAAFMGDGKRDAAGPASLSKGTGASAEDGRGAAVLDRDAKPRLVLGGGKRCRHSHCRTGRDPLRLAPLRKAVRRGFTARVQTARPAGETGSERQQFSAASKSETSTGESWGRKWLRIS